MPPAAMPSAAPGSPRSTIASSSDRPRSPHTRSRTGRKAPSRQVGRRSNSSRSARCAVRIRGGPRATKSSEVRVRRPTIRSVAVAIAALHLTAIGTASQSKAGAPLPAQLDTYITKNVQLTPAERTRLLDGAPVVKLLPSDPAREVAVFGAVWINGAPGEYVRLVRDIEQFERGGAFLVTKRISDPPQLTDFSALKLPQEDLNALRTCRVGDCEIKLGESTLQRL